MTLTLAKNAAANGSDALKFVEGHSDKEFHLLLTDVIMPIMGGKELADKIKKIRPLVDQVNALEAELTEARATI